MTVKPILFSAPMVRALLDGTKTQTRRIFIPPPPFDKGDDMAVEIATGSIGPHQKVGDLLWVRETWCDANSDAGPVVCYRADGHRWQPPFTGPDEGIGPSFDYDRYPGDWLIWAPDLESGREKGWRPSIHMPRWASRLTLEVTGVKVERLQDISEEDATAEGIHRFSTSPAIFGYDPKGTPGPMVGETAKEAFALLWEEINFARGFGWNENPWVVAIISTVHKLNVDELLRQREAA